MKKKLEADLISIAHRVLKLKNKSDINQLYLETQKLYEKLAVLKFIDETFDSVKPTIGLSEINAKIEQTFANENEQQQSIENTNLSNTTTEYFETITDELAVKEEKTQDSIASFTSEKLKKVDEIIRPIVFDKKENEIALAKEDQKNTFEETTETNFSEFPAVFEMKKEKEEIKEPIATTKPEAVQISFEDFIGVDYSKAEFVKVEDIALVSDSKNTDYPEIKAEPINAISEKDSVKATLSLNERLAKGINIDLNDRLAFTKHLFGNNSEDYNRVLNQLITFDTFAETKQFIEDMVKPDYNNWDGKEDYAHRFMEILEKKFL